MVYRVATAFLLLIGFSSHRALAQSSCPVVAQESLTISSQSLPLLLVGNVHVDPHAAVMLSVSPAGRGSVNVRARPSAQGTLVGSIPAGGSLNADGRLSDGTWLHIQLANGSTGWVSASVVKADGDVSSLPTRSTDDMASPSSAGFDLTSSPDSGCPNVPSGVLLQTPDSTGSLILNVDGVILDLNRATVFISNDGQGLGVAVLKGTVQVQSTSTVVPIEAGMETHIARSADGRLTGQPSAPVASDPAEIAQLPLTRLGSTIESTSESTEAVASTETASAAPSYQFAIDSSAPPTCVSGELSADEVAQEVKTLSQNIPPWTTPVRYLRAGESIDVTVSGETKTITATADNQIITLTAQNYGRKNVVAATLVSPGHYEDLHTAANGSRVGYRIDSTSPTALRLTLVFNYLVTVTSGGGSSSSRSCDDFEVYLTGTPQS